MNEESFLISVGRLTITFLEVTDALSSAPSDHKSTKSITTSWLKRPTKEQHYGYAEILYFNESNATNTAEETKTSAAANMQFQTTTLPFSTSGEKLIFGEEFLLENVKSTGKIQILLYVMSVEKNRPQNEFQCVGEALIPIARLEENSTVIQWYQLSNQITKEGIRTAVKIKFLFNTETPATRNNNLLSKRDSLLAFMKGVDSQLTAESLEILNTSVTEATLNLPETPLDANDATESRVTADSSSKIDVSNHVDASTTRPLRRNLTGKQSSEKSVPSPSAKIAQNSSLLSEIESRIDTGLIDYALILGPSTTFITQPTHRLKEHQYERLDLDSLKQMFAEIRSPTFTDLNSPRGMQPPSVNSGLFSAGSFQYLATNEMRIWDRIPVQDLDDMELPSKIEWFACPEGSITVAQATRPSHFLRSFVLNAGGDSGEIYGISLNVFIKTHQREIRMGKGLRLNQENEKFAVSSDSSESLFFSIDPTDKLELSLILSSKSHDEAAVDHQSSNSSTATQIVSSLPIWTMCTICFLFRIPYTEELSKCLEFAYDAVIEPELTRWEEEKELKRSQDKEEVGGKEDQEPISNTNEPVQDQVENDAEYLRDTEPHLSLERPDRHIDEEKQALITSPITPFSPSSSFPFPPCRLLIEKLVSFLFTECPKPIPKLLSISLQLKQAALSRITEKTKDGTPRVKLSDPIQFIARNPEFLPNPSTRYSYILQCFGPRVMLDILTCILSESRMIFYSRDLSKLSIILEGFRQLIYPFIWTHVYLPIVPVQLLNLVEAPVPFLLGTHSDNLVYINLHNLNEIILVDCDNGMIMENTNSVATPELLSSTVRFPEKEDRWLMLSLKEIHRRFRSSPVPPSSSAASSTNSCNACDTPWKEIQSIDQIIQILIFDVLLRLLRYIPDCLFYLSSSCPVFNRPLFMTEYTNEEYRSTLEHLSITNAFHVLTENVYSNSKKFFLFAIKKLEEAQAAEEKEEDDEEELDVSVVDTSYESTEEVTEIRSPIGFKEGAASFSLSRDDGGNNNNLPPLTARKSLNLNTQQSMDIYSSPNAVKPELLNMQSMSNDSTAATNPVPDKVTENIPALTRAGGSLRSAVKFSQPSTLIRKLSQNNAVLNDATGLPTTPHSSTHGPGNSFFNAGTISRSTSAGNIAFNLKAAKSFIRMENSPIFRKQLGTPSEHATPFFTSPFSGLLPEWVIANQFMSVGKNESSSEYLMVLIEQRMKFFKKLMEEYFATDILQEEKGGGGIFSSAVSCKYHIDLSTEISMAVELRAYYEATGEGLEVGNAIATKSDATAIEEREEQSPVNPEPSNTSDAPLPSTQTVISSRTFYQQERGCANPEQELLLFDQQLVFLAQAQTIDWTLGALITTYKFPQVQFLADLRQSSYSSLFREEGHEGNTTGGPFPAGRESTIGHRQSLLAGRTKPGEITLKLSSNATDNQEATETFLPADEIVTDFLQMLLTQQNIDQDIIDQSMIRCTSAFDKQHNRSGFIQMLKNAKQKDHHRPQKKNQTNNNNNNNNSKDFTAVDENIYPLHTTAFECIAKLFLTILTICNQQNDYINAFRLLEIGGHYFQIISLTNNNSNNMKDGIAAHPHHYSTEKKKKSGDEDEGSGGGGSGNGADDNYELQTVEFLSERICHHPIYQLSTMWKGLLLDRLPVDVLKGVSRSQSTDQPRDGRNLSPTALLSSSQSQDNINITPQSKGSYGKKKYHINVIMAEVRSLLYMMLDLGVNSSRALYFIQSITTEYQLTINDYIKLQRFMIDLWSQHYPSFQQQSLSNTNFASLHLPTEFIDLHGGSNGESGFGSLSSASHPGLLHVRSKKTSSKERRDSSAGISELMLKHGHHSHSSHALGSMSQQQQQSLSKSQESLYSESSELNYRQQQQQQQKMEELQHQKQPPQPQPVQLSTKSQDSIVGSVPVYSLSSTGSSEQAFSLHTSVEPFSHSQRSIKNPTRLDSSFVKPSYDLSDVDTRSIASGRQNTNEIASKDSHPMAVPVPSLPTSEDNTHSLDEHAPPSQEDISPFPNTPITPGTGNEQSSSRNRSESQVSGSSSSLSVTNRGRSTSQIDSDRGANNTPDGIALKIGANASYDDDYQQQQHPSRYRTPSTTPASVGILNESELVPQPGEEGGDEAEEEHDSVCDLKLGYYPVAIKGITNEKNIHAMTSIGNWLLLGNDEHLIQVVDLRNFTVVAKLKHANSNLLTSSSTTTTTTTQAHSKSIKPTNSTSSPFHGITVLNALEDTFYYDNYDNNYTHNYVVFSGCQNGMIKVWNLPNCTYHYHHQRYSGDRKDMIYEDEADEEEKQELERQKAQILASQERLFDEEDAGIAAIHEEESGGAGKKSSLATFFGRSTSKRNSKTGLFWSKGSSNNAAASNAPTSPRNAAQSSTNVAAAAALAANNVRIKPSALLTMKTHNSMITTLISQPHPDHLSGWIIASGDCRGDLTIVKSNDGTTVNSTIGMNIKTNTSTTDPLPAPSHSASNLSSSNSKMNHIYLPSSTTMNPNSINDYTISALAFFHTNASYANSFSLPSYLVVGNYLGIINIIDLQYGISIYQSQGHLLKINKIIPSKYPYQFLTCSNDRNILVWDIRMRYPISTTATTGVRGGGGGGFSAHPPPQGKIIDPLHPFTIEERCLGYSIMNSGGGGLGSASSDQASVLSSWSQNHSLAFQNSTHQQLASFYSSTSNNPNGATIHPFYSYKKSSFAPITDIAVGGFDQSIVISTAADGMIKLWDLRYNLTTPYRTIMTGHYPSRISSLIWDRSNSSSTVSPSSPSAAGNHHHRQHHAHSGNFFYTAGYDGVIRSWDTISGNQSHSLNVNLQRIQPAASSTTMMLQAITSSFHNVTASQHGYNQIHAVNANTEKIVQMIKPSFFYENVSSSSSSATGAGGAGVPPPTANPSSSSSRRRYRNCLVTRNWYGGIQLFANNSMHYTDKFGAHHHHHSSSPGVGGGDNASNRKASGPLVGQLLPESTHHGDRSQYHIFV